MQQDGAALVNTSRDYDINEISRYYQSAVIFNIDTSVGSGTIISFEISTIDSLGYYLPYHPPGYFQFKMEGDTFTVKNGYSAAFKKNHWSCCSMNMYIKFSGDIQKIKLVSGKAKKKGKRTIRVFRTRKQLIKGKKKIDLTITLDE
ncbi:MAG: hypothetical protein KKA07_10995 [Bacteroidetes bacterium]|nr:hypothetical protein [Bacteroidota bacterium]